MINIYKVIYKYFDKLEDKVRGKLTHYPIIYAFIGSVGIVSIWRGIWEISDNWHMSGSLSLLLGIFLTLTTGLFISFFIGDNIIISGINQEKRIDEKTEEEIHKERNILENIQKDIKDIKESIQALKK
jgi:uncharacterized protein YneF (UPF0154 family)